MKRGDFLDIAGALISGDRQAQYGDVVEGFRTACAIFEAKTGHRLTPEQGVEFLICVKEAREIVSPQKADTHIDIIGYKALKAEMLKAT